MNAMSQPMLPGPQPDRRESHLRMCRRLGELGMELARMAAARAHTEIANPRPVDSEQPEEPDSVLLFISLAAAVREVIALEASIAAEPATRQAAPPLPDPRRLKLRAAIASATRDPSLRQEMNEHLECELAADPARLVPMQTILETIAEEFDLDLEDLELTPGL